VRSPLPSPGIEYPKLSFFRRVLIPVVSFFVYWVLRLMGPTMRLEILGIQNAIQIPNAGEPGIGVFWHRCIFPAAWVWRGRDIVILNTVNFDGQWTRRVIERLGFGTAQGSSSRGGVGGLTVLADCLAVGRHVGFTIDGPRGPRYVAKPGPVILARRSGKAISVFHIGVEYGHTFQKSWDLFRVPFPFSRTVMFVAPPIRVPEHAGAETMKAKQDEMQRALERVRDCAEAWFSLSDEEKDRLRDEWSPRGSSGAGPGALPRAKAGVA
jgi:lysophospholipid acyltransferase (LPLAT)-like uncharacterized protein